MANFLSCLRKPDQAAEEAIRRPLRIGSFPAELRLIIFAYVCAKNGRDSIRLVCRQWNNEATPLIFKTLRNDFVKDKRKILDSPAITHNNCKISYFMGILPLNGLKSFASRRPLRISVFHQLLRDQARLESLERMDFSELRELKVLKCSNTRRFLNALVPAIEGNASLPVLQIQYEATGRTVEQYGQEMEALENFLKRIPPVVDLTLQAAGLPTASLQEHILRHRDSLRSLVLERASRTFDYHIGPLMLKQVLEECVWLEQLAIGLPPTCLKKDDQPCLVGCTTHVNKTTDILQIVMKSIASAPRLHTLRFWKVNRADRNPPAQWSRENTAYWSATITHLVNQVFENLCERGSRIKVMAFSPLDVPEMSRPSIELLGAEQRWPHYYFVRARVTGALGCEEVLVKPMMGCLEEMAESTILRY